MKLSIRFLVALLALSFTSALFAAKPVNTTLRGVALDGYDAVAYFIAGKPTKGSAKFSHEWNGAKWYFASAENRDAFKMKPEAYAPQYGGYCAWAVSRNYTADTDPEAWKIVEGRLYLNYNRDVQKTWEQDAAGNIGKADRNWPGVLNK
jgi:YHS domain-containing protein